MLKVVSKLMKFVLILNGMRCSWVMSRHKPSLGKPTDDTLRTRKADSATNLINQWGILSPRTSI